MISSTEQKNVLHAATGSNRAVRKLRNGLIVSCQASVSSPFNRTGIIAALASIAEQQGAVGVRIDGVSNIRAVRRLVSVPIVGIEKRHLRGYPVYITPTFDSICQVFQAGADIVALDCTGRRRPKGHSIREMIRRVRSGFKGGIMADVATVDEGLAAADLGVDLISTTLHGYTRNNRNHQTPGFELLKGLVRRTDLPVILEGRVHTPGEVKRAFDLGAYSVVVGTAITNPEWLTRQFVDATPGAKPTTRGTEIGE